MTINPNTGRKHGAGMKVGPGVMEAHVAAKEYNQKAEADRVKDAVRRKQRNDATLHFNPRNK